MLYTLNIHNFVNYTSVKLKKLNKNRQMLGKYLYTYLYFIIYSKIQTSTIYLQPSPPKAKTKPNRNTLEELPLKSEAKHSYLCTPPPLFTTVVEVLPITIRQQKENVGIQLGEKRLKYHYLQIILLYT